MLREGDRADLMLASVNQHNREGQRRSQRPAPSAAHAPARACRNTRLRLQPDQGAELGKEIRIQTLQLLAVGNHSLEKDQRTRVANQCRPPRAAGRAKDPTGTTSLAANAGRTLGPSARDRRWAAGNGPSKATDPKRSPGFPE